MQGNSIKIITYYIHLGVIQEGNPFLRTSLWTDKDIEIKWWGVNEHIKDDVSKFLRGLLESFPFYSTFPKV